MYTRGGFTQRRGKPRGGEPNAGERGRGENTSSGFVDNPRQGDPPFLENTGATAGHFIRRSRKFFVDDLPQRGGSPYKISHPKFVGGPFVGEKHLIVAAPFWGKPPTRGGVCPLGARTTYIFFLQKKCGASMDQVTHPPHSVGSPHGERFRSP